MCRMMALTETIECAADGLRSALKRHFGFDDFQAGQAEVVADVLSGRPTLAIMPTGAGKSLCYQLPALMVPGMTVVVSPLIALMKDQVDTLRARGIAAEVLNSTLSPEAQQDVAVRAARGEVKLLYVAPERFRSGGLVRLLERSPPALFAVDEAHCISQWGHDFRPDYVRIGEVIERVRPQRVLACTATATPEVRTDIARVMGLVEPAVHVAGFLRDNLYLEARLCSGDSDRTTRLLAFIRQMEGPGAVIVYAATRKRVERFAAELATAFGAGAVAAYHAGLDDPARVSAQDRFMRGEARIVVATNAFGMGVDRADVRAVVHVDLPRTLEGYYQEVGRAGRDRLPARGLLLHSAGDVRLLERMIDQSHPDEERLASVWRALRRAGDDGVAVERLTHAAGLEYDGQTESALRVLDGVGAVQRDGAGRVRAHPEAPNAVRDLDIDLESLALRARGEHDRLRGVRKFVQAGTCRHAALLGHFGERFRGDCPGCDRCQPGGAVGADGGEPPTREDVDRIVASLKAVGDFDGRYGLRKLSAMLAGSKSKDLAGSPLLRAEAFGALRPLATDACFALLRDLVDRGLLVVGLGEYPTVTLSREGWSIANGRDEPDFRPPLVARTSPIVARRARALRPLHR
jgi:ATP-dependent DNA helicase RecQ